MEKYFKPIVAGVSTGITWIFGTWDLALQILVAFMILDYFTGLLRGYMEIKNYQVMLGLKV